MISNKEKVITNHLRSLSAHYAESLSKYAFEEPKLIEGQEDSAVSNSPSKKTAFITRHLLTSEVTHSIILDKDWYSRL